MYRCVANSVPLCAGLKSVPARKSLVVSGVCQEEQLLCLCDDWGMFPPVRQSVSLLALLILFLSFH